MDDLLNPTGPRNPNSHIADKNAMNPEQFETEPDNFEEGTEELTMPSRGVFYNPPYFNSEILHCRHLDWRDEDILTTKKFIDDGTVYDKLVSAVIQDPNMNAYNLVPVDRDTILLWLRANALGKDVNIEYKCARCGSNHTATWDLSKLDIPQYKSEIYEELKKNSEVRIETPLKNIPVYIKIPLIRESRDTEKRLKAIKEKSKSETDGIGTGIIDLIVSGIENEEGQIIRNKEAIKRYFDNVKLPIADLRYIKRKVDDLNLKYDTAQDLVCGSCGYVREGVELPIVHPNFLWPDS